MNQPQRNKIEAAYIHVPFCARRCGYCNFTLIAGRDELIDSYLQALQIELSGLKTSRELKTLFIGGGTPTHLPPDKLIAFLQLVSQWFSLVDGYEFSVECNPENMSPEVSNILSDFGVNRISLGAQSFDSAKLKTLEREHAAEDIRQSVRLAKEFADSVSIDLIFGVPGESLDIWQKDLQAALDLEPNHISTYGLTYEKGTSYWAQRSKGGLQPLDENIEREMYALGINTLHQAGYEHYEVSNFAKPGYRCRHNEVYWSGQHYYAFGPGAARYVGANRETNHRSTTTYIKRLQNGQSPVGEIDELSSEHRARELLVIALRRLDGVEEEWFTQQTGFTLAQLVDEPVQQYVELGFMSYQQGRLKLTQEGLFISDALWPAMLSG